MNAILIVHSVEPYVAGVSAEFVRHGWQTQAVVGGVKTCHAADLRGWVLLYESTVGSDVTQLRIGCGFGATVAIVDLEDVDEVRRALALGGTGVVDRRASCDEIRSVVGLARERRACIPSELLHRLATGSGEPTPSGCAMTDDELVILRLLARGDRIADIAEVVHRSERDLYRVFRSLWARLGADGRADGLVLAARAGLLDDPPQALRALG